MYVFDANVIAGTVVRVVTYCNRLYVSMYGRLLHRPPATQGKQKKSFFYFSKQGKIRDFVKNVKYQGNLRKSLNLKLRKNPGNF